MVLLYGLEPEGFPKGWTLEEFAESRPRYRDVILQNKKLKEYFEENS